MGSLVDVDGLGFGSGLGMVCNWFLVGYGRADKVVSKPQLEGFQAMAFWILVQYLGLAFDANQDLGASLCLLAFVVFVKAV